MEIRAGTVTHYYSRIGVAVVQLTQELKVGDTILILGHTTDLTQQVGSMEINHQKVQVVPAGREVALKVSEPVRRGDAVFKIVSEWIDNPTLWELMQKVESSLIAHYQPAIDQFIAQHDLARGVFGVLLAALTLEPEVTTPVRLQVRGPYTSAETYQARAMAGVEKGFLREVAPAEYQLTEIGREELQRLIRDGRQLMAQVDPLPLADSQRLAAYLGRLVQACLNTAPPPENWSIRLSYRLMPALDPPLPYIEQAISCLYAYRDDAHLAAWRPSGLEAVAIETLTLLWRGQADSLAAILQQLAHRGYTSNVYSEALSELRRRGYVEGDENALRVTESGKAFRQKIEEDTDRFFYAPWSCLDHSDRADLAQLLKRLHAGLPQTAQGEGP